MCDNSQNLHLHLLILDLIFLLTLMSLNEDVLIVLNLHFTDYIEFRMVFIVCLLFRLLLLYSI